VCKEIKNSIFRCDAHIKKCTCKYKCILLNNSPVSKDVSFMLSLLLDKKPFTKKMRLLDWAPAFLNFRSAFEILCSKNKDSLSLSSDLMHYRLWSIIFQNFNTCKQLVFQPRIHGTKIPIVNYRKCNCEIWGYEAGKYKSDCLIQCYAV